MRKLGFGLAIVVTLGCFAWCGAIAFRPAICLILGPVNQDFILSRETVEKIRKQGRVSLEIKEDPGTISSDCTYVFQEKNGKMHTPREFGGIIRAVRSEDGELLWDAATADKPGAIEYIGSGAEYSDAGEYHYVTFGIEP